MAIEATWGLQKNAINNTDLCADLQSPQKQSSAQALFSISPKSTPFHYFRFLFQSWNKAV